MLSVRALAKNCYADLDDKRGATSSNWKSGKPVRVVSVAVGLLPCLILIGCVISSFWPCYHGDSPQLSYH